MVKDLPEGTKACGRDSFNPKFDRCCSDNVVLNAKRLGIHCCGAISYSKETHKCCVTGVRPKGIDGLDCGKELFATFAQLMSIWGQQTLSAL